MKPFTICNRCGMRFDVEEPRHSNTEHMRCSESGCGRRFWSELPRAQPVSGIGRRPRQGMLPSAYEQFFEVEYVARSSMTR